MPDNTLTADLPYLQEQLQDIISKADIRSVFQPILSLRDGSVLGYEALSRGPQGSELESPERLFFVAERCDRLWDLELLCRTKALAALQRIGIDSNIFLNVNPNVIEDKKFQQGFTKEYLKEYGINPENIIFEITERSAIENINEFKKIISNYKNQDYKIAIDDAGAGYSGLNLISDIYPHYLKLDMNLIRGIDKDNIKQALVRSLCEFTRITGTELIAEGIETSSELQTLIEIGVHYGQGYFIQRPSSVLSQIPADLIRTVTNLNAKKNHIFGYNLSEIYIGNLCINAVTVNESVTISQAYEMLKNNEGVPGFCITGEGLVLGVVTRDRLNSMVGGQYGYSLYSRRNISSIMNREFLSVDCKMPVNAAARLAMSRPDATVYDFITVTLDAKYYGIVTIKDLLNKTIEIEVTNATHLNPLTALPGNILIEKKLSEALRLASPCCVLYLDLDNFKSYNDVYGFENGDRVIKKVADIITNHITEPNFVGHVGGDDFIAIIDARDIKQVECFCQNILSEFAETITDYYKAEDVENGYIISKNRHGFEEQFPLLSFSIAGVMIEGKGFLDVYGISEEASRIKKECKQITGNAFLIV